MDSVSRLLNDVEAVRQARNEDCVRLLQELTPHLRAVREQDRHLAHHFNVFRYLRDDELGLSRIIADLLDPTDEHGQGATYLEAMLELLELREVAPAESDSGYVRVVTERGAGSRFIDITVDIPTDGGTFCLAFENKPYADDQHRQCIDYLKFLKREYGERFLLVYLPPRYWMPEESSLPLADYREHWTKHFRVLPYVADDAPLGDDDPSDDDGEALVRADSGVDDARAANEELVEDTATDDEATPARANAVVGDGASLADWFGTCCKLSDPERLRWFLREAQLYCQKHFGDSTMTDTEARYIREYLDENPRHLHAAYAVHRAWPALKHDVCRRFLEHLRDRVEERVSVEMPKIRQDLQVDCHYGGEKRGSNRLRLMRIIMIESGGPGPNGWYGASATPTRRRCAKSCRPRLSVATSRFNIPKTGGPNGNTSPAMDTGTALSLNSSRNLPKAAAESPITTSTGSSTSPKRLSPPLTKWSWRTRAPRLRRTPEPIPRQPTSEPQFSSRIGSFSPVISHRVSTMGMTPAP